MNQFEKIEEYLISGNASEIVIDFEGDKKACIDFIEKFIARGLGNTESGWKNSSYESYSLDYLAFELDGDNCSMYRASAHKTLESYKSEYVDSYYISYDKFFNVKKGIKKKLEL